MKSPSRPENAPCDYCPYHLGILHTFVNPCPRCMSNGYAFFERLTNPYEDPIDTKKPGPTRQN